MIESARTLLEEPREPGALGPQRSDWLLVAALMVLGLLEVSLADGVVWRPLAGLIAVVAVFTLPWRRTRPLAAILAVGAVQVSADLVSYPAVGGTTGVNATMLTAFLLVYALWRWEAGRLVALGMLAVLAFNLASELADTSNSLLEDLLSNVQWFLPAALGMVFRYRARLRDRAVDEARLEERHRLARELHDTVAHHVSAIAVQAQAGRAIAATRPDDLDGILEDIEVTASRTLQEMRHMVGVMRDDEGDGARTPRAGLDDLAELGWAGSEGGSALGPDVDVQFIGEVNGLAPSIETTLFRLAREALTNARRHARNATRVEIRVQGDGDAVRLTVTDDGDPVAGSSRRGHGLVGMEQRVELLRGSFSAAPRPDRGWAVDVSLPRTPPGAGGDIGHYRAGSASA
ncbi:MAG: sensor histidine kinase [Microthrixaceae bacterium]